MTDTEAKALALVKRLRDAAEYTKSYGKPTRNGALMYEAAEYIEREEAAEARHAAEMRELKERFSEAAAKVDTMLAKRGTLRDNPLRQALAPFIIPAPDMVSEWLSECSDGRVSDHTMTMLRLFHHWLSEKETRKIVWEAEE